VTGAEDDIEVIGELNSGPAPLRDEEGTNAAVCGRRVLARQEFHTPPEEIRRSLSSPGKADVLPGARALSLYNFATTART